MRTLTRSSLTIGLLAMSSMLWSTGLSADEYEVLNPDVFGSSAIAVALNDAGQALALRDQDDTGALDSTWVVFDRDAAESYEMPVPVGWSQVGAVGLTAPVPPKAVGFVWGDATVATGASRGFVWDPGTGAVQEVGALDGAPDNHLIGMDSAGWAYVQSWVPNSHPPTLPTRAFVWNPSQPDDRIEVVPPGTHDAVALWQVKPNGKALVVAYAEGAVVAAFVWTRTTGAFVELQDWNGDGGTLIDSAGGAVGGFYQWSPSGVRSQRPAEVPAFVFAEFLTDSGWIASTDYSPSPHPTGPSPDDGVHRFPYVWHRDGRTFDLRADIEAVGGISAMPQVVTEDGLVVGRIWTLPNGTNVQLGVFVWDADRGLAHLTEDQPGDGNPVYLHAVTPAGKVVFGRPQHFFERLDVWQRVHGIEVTSYVADVYPTGGEYDPSSGFLANARGEFFAGGVGGLVLVVPGGGTPTGGDVEVSPDETTKITFGDVTAPGETTVTVYDVDDPEAPQIPADFQLAGTDTLLNISTTATLADGSVVLLAIQYDDTGMSAFRESQIRLLHFEDPQWVDVTDYGRSGGFLDTTNNVVYGRTTSLSPFALVLPVYSFGGFESPVNADGSSIFKANRTVPLEFGLQGPDGEVVTGAEARLRLYRVSDEILGTVEEADVASSGSANDDDLFRHEGAKYVFNLSTQGLATGHYRADAHLDDGSTHSVSFSLR